MKTAYLISAAWCLSVVVIGGRPASAEEARAALVITAPLSRQVVQRDGRNSADLPIRGTVTGGVDVIEAKADVAEGGTGGQGTAWTVVGRDVSAGGDFTGRLHLEAGGWYKITVRATKGGQVVGEAVVDKSGVGEVFITAGQSNSANFGTPKQTAKDDRVVYFDGKLFVPAQDPIPGGCGGGGSPWSIAGDLLAKSQGVPVCFRSASLNWTEVKSWLPPDTALYKNLVQCVKPFGPHGVRAVLWHQGESDTLVSTPAAAYCERVKTIIDTLSQDAGYEIPWLVAQASFHPGSSEPQQKEVAQGQRMLWEKKVAQPGPNTDELRGAEFRSDGVHFNDKGLHKHGELWAEKIAVWLAAKSAAGRSAK